MFTDDKITEIFVMCDEFSQKFDEFFKKTSLEAPKSGKRKYYRAPRMCDSEVMTILILFHKSGYRCLKHYYLNHTNQKNRPFATPSLCNQNLTF